MGPRILIVNVNWIGDVLFSTPAIRALKKHFPKNHLSCLVPTRCEDLLKHNPYLDEVIAAGGALDLLCVLRKRKFDTAIFFHRSKTKVAMAALAGIKERIGFERSGSRRWLTRAMPQAPISCHRSEIFLDLVAKLGAPRDGRHLDFYPAPEAEGDLDNLLASIGLSIENPYVVVHAGGNWDLKRWPASYFVKWIDRFLGSTGWPVILCGTPGEENLSQEILSHFFGKPVFSVCGKTDLNVLGHLLKHARLLLSNDSGPIHLAASQKTPLVGIYGPTSPLETGPVSEARLAVLHKEVGCEVPCYFRSCNNRVCMHWITPEEVFEETRRVLAV